jgi:urease accessory protein
MNLHDLQAAPAAAAWQARLQLRYERADGSTRLTHRKHSGPLLVQKALHPEGDEVCHSLLVHPPGGIAGGDRLEIDVTVGERARALITTPGAAKWYRSSGPAAEQRATLAVGLGASLEWFPQESIVFDGARMRASARVELAEEACFIGWDITRLGRTASGERFGAGELRSRFEVLQAGRRLWGEYARIEGGAPLLRSPAGLAGHPVTGCFLAAGAAFDAELLDACRAAAPRGDARWGVTALPGVMVARYLGVSTEAARSYFVELWRCARPALLGREICLPRIWST